MRTENKGRETSPFPLNLEPAEERRGDVVLAPLSSRQDILAEFTKAVHL